MRYLSGLLASISIILAGCGGGEAGQGEVAVGSSAGSSIAPVALTIGGTVSGLGTGLQVTLLNSLGNATIASNNGAFTFSNPISDKESYSVTVGTQPIGQICMVSDGSGTGTATAVANVQVHCSAVWGPQVSQRWIGSNLEGVIDYCKNRSIRWIAPISGFDLNKDGISDFLMPISCYQGPDTQPGEKHNRELIAAWKMFCSRADKSFYDCTSEKFGSNVINATGTSSGGGNPAIHVMEQPFDINSDGYPDFWYALNRDDGRPGFRFDNPSDYKLLTQFCGPQQEEGTYWDCTRKSNQSVLLSQADGTYKVEILPWSPTNTQAMIMLPNTIGTYDVVSYGEQRAARLVGNKFIDVSKEYLAYNDFNSAYVRALKVDGKTYVVKSGIPSEYLDKKISMANGEWGFSLWLWTPGKGFTLTDYYSPPLENIFAYKEKSESSYQNRYGAYIRGVPMFSPAWHFFNYTTLDSSEGPILVVTQESGSTAGNYYKSAIDSKGIYSWDANSDNRYQITPLSAIEAFYIRSGKLTPRLKSVVESDVVWNTPGIIFEDLNADGHIDAIGVTGHSQRGSVYINNKAGTLRKIYTSSYIPSMKNYDPGDQDSFAWTIRNLGNSPKLDFLYWGPGSIDWPSWMSGVYKQQDIVLIKGQISVDLMPVHLPDLMQKEIQTCLTNMTWIDTCGFE